MKNFLFIVYSKEKLVFTQEELRVIQECNRESFYYRCKILQFLVIIFYWTKTGYIDNIFIY